MGVLVCFHAHPDDESMTTGGTIARAKAEGHRVVLIVATGGEHGEVPADLAPGETLVERRREELARSAEVLGIDRVVRLGYRDSGMTGWEHNGHPESFLSADVDEAAGRLAAVLREESADVLTSYDWHGNYGHPDHIKVHQVGARAAELVADDLPRLRVFEATMNRDAMARLFAEAVEQGMVLDPDGSGEEWDPHAPADDGNPFGMPEAELTHEVDVTPYVDAKRASIACHRSQATDSAFFLEMPEEAFRRAFSTEWYIERGASPGLTSGWLFDDAGEGRDAVTTPR
jgi:LmbE family N-acetylglucosaminyl deacetylase